MIKWSKNLNPPQSAFPKVGDLEESMESPLLKRGIQGDLKNQPAEGIFSKPWISS